MGGLVVEAHHLLGAERDRGVCSAGVVAEFYFEDPRRKDLDHGSHLPTFPRRTNANGRYDGQ